MNLNIACSIALGISLLLIILSIVLGTLLHRSELKSTGLEGRRRILTSFQIFLLCFFFAAVSIFFPVYYIDYLAAETGFLRIVKAFLLSVQNVLRLITLNGEFNNIRDFLADFSRVNAVLGECYSIYAAIIFLAAPLLTAGFVLSFFRNTSAMLRYSLRPCRELYVMSELNERSLALAKNILGEGKRGRIVIFADVFEDNEERNYELVFMARRMGAICVKKDVTDLGLKYARRCRRKVYLIGANEDENIGQALKLIHRHRGTKYDSNDLEFYIFSQTAESEVLLDSVDNGNMRVRRINESNRLALSEMQAHPIFGGIEGQKEKRVRVALVGFGGYGMQFLKMICCLGQMPGWDVELHVFDMENAEGRLKAVAPELISLNGKQIVGEAEYKIVFHDPVDVRSSEFIEEFVSADDYTGVYVALGEDELNIETAMRLMSAFRRTGHSAAPIYAVVYDPTKAEIVSGSGLKNMEGEEYGIVFIGALHRFYCLENIEQREQEEKAAILHMQWAETEAEKKEARKKFEQYEYYRRSSMMQAIYRDLRTKLGYVRESDETPEGRANNDTLRLYEHRRWNTYMRAEGYVYGEEKDHIAKTHPLLISFNDLPEEEKKKDDF